ncbi:UDP-N-acetylglucosamine 1-carboxyvinyltransferase [Candidatus Peregrinibacteria bacterium]|nr:UDP-N-acetylglucosamine 1-carboxyvinyltransferase [Candidatus Peregrinibacteria bacterium]
MPKFLIDGGKKLNGEIHVSGSKNATLPILAACLLTDEPCTLKNVPDIADVHSMIHLLKGLGVKVRFQNNTVLIHAEKVKKTAIDDPLVGKFRASILLLGPLLRRLGDVRLNFPGGCVLGKRSIYAHLHALQELGGKIEGKSTHIHLRGNHLQGKNFVMSEISVTATENAIMAAVLAEGMTIIRLAAAEPHVQDLCLFLNKMGARIKGIGTHALIIHGVKKLKGTGYKITSDYLEVGTLALAAALTKGTVTIKGIESHHLDSFWNKLEEVGAKFELKTNEVTIYPTDHFMAVEKLRTAVYPSFATDLQAPFSVLLTQADGESFIFETLFEGRLNYLFELEKMGAKLAIINPHQARIHGPTALKAVPVASCDIRAGTAMVLAALIAKGTTEISNIYYIDRGYENLDKKLRSLGASIQRSEEKL